jgi:hypothetical protein
MSIRQMGRAASRGGYLAGPRAVGFRVVAAASFRRLLKRLSRRSVTNKRRTGTGRRALAEKTAIEPNLIFGPDAHT